MFRSLFFLCFFSYFLFPNFLSGQIQFQGDHRPAIVGSFHALQPSANELFVHRMNGVVGGDLSFRLPVVQDLFIGVGGALSNLQHARPEQNLLDEKAQLLSYGPFFQVGYQSLLGEIFQIGLGVKGGYRVLEFNSPLCDQKGRKRIHSQDGFMVEPGVGFWWDAGDGLRFGADVGLALYRNSFSTDLICEDMKTDFPEADGEGYRIWNFGFSFSKDLIDAQR